jgi:cell fate regulator YaaT (PSP1 superfamily)
MAQQYLVRYGAMAFVDRFAAPDDLVLERGAAVIVRSGRGVELGEVLGARSVAPTGGFAAGDANRISILRRATPDDLRQSSRTNAQREAVRLACEEASAAHHWNLSLLDAELMVDHEQAVVYCLGSLPAPLDVVERALSERSGFRIQLMPVGQAPDPIEDGCGACGTGGGCGTSGGCGAGGCSSCALG